MERKIRSILVVTPGYPYESEMNFPFVKNLCEEFTRMGCEVTVLCPQSTTSKLLHGKLRRPTERHDIVDNKIINIYQPYCITAPTKYHNINNLFLRLGLRLFFLRHKQTPDVCYCHFWSSGYAALPFSQKHHIPLFVATGESDIHSMFSSYFGIKKLRNYVKGTICVSSKNREESVKLNLTTAEKCEVFPNAVNAELFHKQDQEECREMLGFPQDKFIVAFVGWFIDRKGPRRVAAAINQLKDVKGIFIGKGEQEPQCDGTLFKGVIPHDNIPIYLGAADVFVLPTLHEGCCNAVIEAMACGLPIISSNLPFNWDVLDDNNSIMVDPDSVDEIADAIKTLRDNPELKKRLSEGALKKAEKLTIDKRAEGILHFMETKISN